MEKTSVASGSNQKEKTPYYKRSVESGLLVRRTNPRPNKYSYGRKERELREKSPGRREVQVYGCSGK